MSRSICSSSFIAVRVCAVTLLATLCSQPSVSAQSVFQLHNGNLVIVGKTTADSFQILPLTIANRSGEIRILFNGAEHGFRGVTGIQLTGNGGNDIVDIQRINLPGSFSFNMGNDDDWIRFRFGGSRIEGNLSVNLGNGENTFDLEDPPSGQINSLRVDGRVDVFGGNNRDVVLFMGSLQNISGDFQVDLGDGDNQFRHFSGSIVGGNETYRGGSGNDDVGILYDNSGYGVTVEEDLVLDLGDGTNDVFVNRARIRGATTIVGGDGTDDVKIPVSQQDGPLTINLGGGDDFVNISATAGTVISSIQFNNSVSVATGSGSDEILLQGGLWLGPATFHMGNGNELDEFTGLGCQFEDDIEVTSGGGPDTIELGVVAVKRRLGVDSGSGWDDIFVTQSTLAGPGLWINTRSGEDVVTIRDSIVDAPLQVFMGNGIDSFTSDAVQYNHSGPSPALSVFGGGAFDTAAFLDMKIPTTAIFQSVESIISN